MLSTKAVAAALSGMGTVSTALQPEVGRFFVVPGVGSTYLLFVVSSFVLAACVGLSRWVVPSKRNYYRYYLYVASSCVAFPWAGLVTLGGSVFLQGTGTLGMIGLTMLYGSLGMFSLMFLTFAIKGRPPAKTRTEVRPAWLYGVGLFKR